MEYIPTTTKPISEIDCNFPGSGSFEPARETGPHLPPSADVNGSHTPLELFRQFLSDDVLDHIIEATKAYAEQQKEGKRAMYLCFSKSPLTREEMMRYMATYLLLSLSSIQSYRKAWSKKSSQVRHSLTNSLDAAIASIIPYFQKYNNIHTKYLCMLHTLSK